MSGSPETTNLLLAIMATVSVLEGLLIIGFGIAAWKAYSRVTGLIEGLEERHVAPAMIKVNHILDEARVVTTHFREETERVQRGIQHTIDRVDHTAHRLRDDVRSKTSWLVGTVRGVRAVLLDLLRSQPATMNRDIEDVAPSRTH
jgi:hypothetical protein